MSPKRSPKSIFEEGQTSRECHVKQAVPNSKGRACHVEKVGEEDIDSTWEDRATGAEVARPARATSAMVRPDFKCGFSCFFGEIDSFS